MRRLHLCAHYGDAEEVEEILKRSDPFLVDYADQLGQTSLHLAASAGRVDVAKVLLQRGANVNAKDIDGGTPISVACTRGHAAIVDLLLKFGADIEVRNNKGQTPLHCAAMAGAVEVFKLLVEFGADFNAVSAHQRTPLDCPHLHCPTSNYILVIESHVTKMASAKLPYIKLASFRPGVMDLDAKRTYKKKCLSELACLKEFLFPGTKICLYDFLTRPNSVHGFIRNPDICKIVLEMDFAPKFPIYGRLLEHNLFKGFRRLALIETASAFFSATRNFSDLPLECFENVCSYLDDRTLCYLGLVWAWSQSAEAQTAPSSSLSRINSVANRTDCSSETCSMAGMAHMKVWSIVGLCLSKYMHPQPSNSIS